MTRPTRCVGLVAALAGLALLVAPMGSGEAAPRADCETGSVTRVVQADDTCLVIVTTFPVSPPERSVLVIGIHGDLREGRKGDYIFDVARRAAALGVVGVGMIRPGYPGDGRVSTGTALFDEPPEDRYSADEMDRIADAIRRLAYLHDAEDVVVVGYSGGGNATGVILGRHPGLIDRAILLGCPCDVARWREMWGRAPYPKAESAHAYIDRVPKGTVIRLFTGADDDVTPPLLGEDYAAAARAAGLDATFLAVEGANHDYAPALVDTPAFEAALREMVFGEGG
jgi:pimeloyl-ACP methyl ester carboxylesterase